MKPHEQAEIEAVARVLDGYSLGRTAARLRALLDPIDDERPCPIQDRTRQISAIPWGLAEILYPAYGHAQTLERLAERGGFGRRELGMLAVDFYDGEPGRERPRLSRMPLLDLYDMAKRAQLQATVSVATRKGV